MQYLQKICAHAALLSISLLVAGKSGRDSVLAVVPDRALRTQRHFDTRIAKDRL